jgi:hypothetical protein
MLPGVATVIHEVRQQLRKEFAAEIEKLRSEFDLRISALWPRWRGRRSGHCTGAATRSGGARNGVDGVAFAGERSSEATSRTGCKRRRPFLAAKRKTYARLELFSF